jgi:hypothetical protein
MLTTTLARHFKVRHKHVVERLLRLYPDATPVPETYRGTEFTAYRVPTDVLPALLTRIAPPRYHALVHQAHRLALHALTARRPHPALVSYCELANVPVPEAPFQALKLFRNLPDNLDIALLLDARALEVIIDSLALGRSIQDIHQTALRELASFEKELAILDINGMD